MHCFASSYGRRRVSMDIMLVDDEPFIREGLKRLVDWGKYDCHIAAEAGNGMGYGSAA